MLEELDLLLSLATYFLGEPGAHLMHLSYSRRRAFELLRQGCSVDEVCKHLPFEITHAALEKAIGNFAAELLAQEARKEGR